MDTQVNDNEVELKALEAFVVDNPELEQVEALRSQFNLFEAIGAVRMEVRHSDFLAFLLDPSENHRLGDLFLKRMLQNILAANVPNPGGIRPVDLALMDLSSTSVHRERDRTDILCVNAEKAKPLVILIENKIDSGEGEGQLEKYLQEVERNYPGFTTIPLYLTPEGDAPADEKSRYIPVPYTLVCETLEDLLKSRRLVMDTDVFTTVSHYVQMLRRYIVSDSPIAELAKKIYAKHAKALELIFEHRPDEKSEWSRRFQDLVKAEPQLDLDHSARPRIRFVPKEWDAIKELKKGPDFKNGGWSTQNRILLFEFINEPDSHIIRLNLVIGPCEPGAEQVREKLFKHCQERGDLYNRAVKKKNLPAKYSTIRSQDLLARKDFDESDIEELWEKILPKWQTFLTKELPALVSAVNGVFGR